MSTIRGSGVARPSPGPRRRHLYTEQRAKLKVKATTAAVEPASLPVVPVVLPEPPLDLASEAESGDGYQGRGVFGGCEWTFFQEFKGKAHGWFVRKRIHMALFHEFIGIVAQFDDVYESCPAAALTGFLLKMESLHFEEDAIFYDLFDVYTSRYQRAVAEGTLLASHHVGWPLVQGLERVLELRRLGRAWAQQRELRRASGDEPEASMDLVICFCAERLVWLRALHKVPWKVQDRAADIRRNVALRLYHKCPPSTAEEQLAETQRLVSDWAGYFREVEVRYVWDAARADDCSAYLAYIVDRYDSLPDYAVFLHADAPEHIPSLDLLTDTVFAASRGYLPEEVGFVHLAHNHVAHGCRPYENCETRRYDVFEFPRLWRAIFGSSIVPSLGNGDIHAYCCVQFLVRRDRIRLRPLSFYQRALAYFGETLASYYDLFAAKRFVRPSDVVGRTPCQHAMYIWHVMFGEALRLPRRQKDPNLPLFMKLLNIEVEAMDDETVSEDMITSIITSQNHVAAGPHSTSARVLSLFD